MSTDFIVTQKAQRPANINGKGFYCNSKIGDFHKYDCVLVKKKVKIRMIIEYEISVPFFWDKEQIEFHRNKSSWCASNAIDEIDLLKPCVCHCTKFEFIEDTSKPYICED